MKYYLVAGEASGDLHGSNLMHAIKQLDENASFRFYGGDLMQAQGGELVGHYRDRAYMGLWEVIKNIRTIKKILTQAKNDIVHFNPDKLILIDNPGFNLRLAKFVHKKNIKVHYYIAPKVWAWNTKRVVKIQKNVDYLYSILPFEINFFKQHNVRVEYVGNPLLDEMAAFEKEEDFLIKNNIDKPIIALLPGSRKNEIDNLLPIMIQSTKNFQNHSIVIAAAMSFPPDYYKPFLGNSTAILVYNKTQQILAHAQAAIVASGTATLETALFNVPQVVIYKVAKLTYTIGKRLIKVPFISLVNLIANKKVVTELIQNDCNEKQIEQELQQLLLPEKVVEIKKEYATIKSQLGNAGASAKVAELILRNN